jgi:NADPH2:quinone reductase
VVDKLGAGVSTVGLGQTVAALPVIGGYAEFICLPQEELVPVPAGLDPGEAVSLVLNHVTAYQMLHRSAHVQSGQRVLVHSATGGVGTALLQLGRLVDLEVYGTASQRPPETVSGLGGTLIDYQQVEFVEELLRLTGNGVDVVFDGIGGTHLWRSLKALRAGGKVVAYGLTSSLRGGRLVGRRRHRLRGLAIIGLSIIATFFLPGRKRMLLYSIQTLKRRRPAWFHEDLTALLELLHQGRIIPMIAERIPLGEARRAHELLGRGSVTGKIVLLCER